jgi:hypothetical protein
MNLLAPAEDPPTPPPTSSAVLVVPVDTTDAQLLELWLHGKSRHTQRAYRTEAMARPLSGQLRSSGRCRVRPC